MPEEVSPMKKPVKIVLCILAALILLAAAVYGVLYFFFDIDIFDRSGWKTDEDGSRYYLDYHGDPLTQWQQIDGTLHYFDPESGRLMSGWIECLGSHYYLDADGVPATGWLTLDADTYYFDPDGAMQTGWLTLETGTYFLDSQGRMQTGWLETEDGRYYLDDNGVMLTGGWTLRTEATISAKTA